ncbi:MAG: hypothetical protein CBB97_07110 [Candidatus Endolissoclinum sp. TMED37]|nr:MAG: hypothetical protein CBB97_07110 [Candidatus Endolissoclinum sp. TMED37]
MTIPLTREMAINACRRMVSFHSDLCSIYKAHGMNLFANRGRRNILMSAPMEKFLADELQKLGDFKDVKSDGRTGEPDISVYYENDKIEIECKLTSPHQSSNSIAFQTDHDTLVNKGSLDYIYMIANPDFDGFCVIYFKDLTIDEFRGLSPGARGKVQMFKHQGMKKATVLIGQAISHDQVKIEKIAEDTRVKLENKSLQLAEWRKELENISPTAKYRKKELDQAVLNGLNYVDTTVNNAAEKVRMIRSRDKSSYSFKFETIGYVK